MKIKWGMMMTDGRGKLGGQVASKNRSGAYVRTKVTPDNPQTTFQQENRAFLGNLSTAWSGLTTQQQLAWNAQVENWKKTDIFGDLRKPTGKNLFVALNKPLLQYTTTAMLVLPPEKVDLPIPVQINMTVTESTFNAQVVLSEQAPAGTVLLFEVTPNLSRGTFYAKNKYRVVNPYSIPSASGQITVNLRQALQNRYGELPKPDEFNSFLRVSLVSAQTGQKGVPLAGLIVNGALIPDPDEEE